MFFCFPMHMLQIFTVSGFVPELRGTYDDTEVAGNENELEDWFAADWEPRDEIRDLLETDIDLQLS